MAFEFLFVPFEKTDSTQLYQGDILRKDDVLKEAINVAHPYYAEADDYTHLMVLTQSCDLVRRNGQKPKSRYITLAAIRPLRIIVDRLIKKYKFDSFDFPFPVCQKESEIFIAQVLERLLHNTEHGYFFIRKDSHPKIKEDMCVFLTLSIAIRVAHIDACLKAKIAELDHIFQAKVGWLTGNLYSRVGTPDIEEIEDDPKTIKAEFYKEILHNQTAWLTPGQLTELKKIVAKWRRDNPGEDLTPEKAEELINKVPDPMDLVAQRAVTSLATEGIIEDNDETRTRAKNLLRNDLPLKKLITLSKFPQLDR